MSLLMNRRSFLMASSALSVAPLAVWGETPGTLAAVPPEDQPAAAWYRGNLHMHSKWSDGQVMPEDAVAWYRDHGYHFVCLSDHELVQTDPDSWLEVGSNKLSRESADAYIKAWPGKAEVREKEGKQSIRLKTVWELKREFDKQDSFLMISGMESSQNHLHMNLINVHETLPYRFAETHTETFRRNEAAFRAWSDEHGMKSLFMLNHPTWPYFDILPEVLIGLPQIRFFELCNADAGNWFPAHPSWYSTEKYWDIVNAFRIEDGYNPVFGTATDDTHLYTNPKGPLRPGGGWVCVRAERLEPEALVQAMYNGDFYSSTGVALEDVAFDAAAGTLRVLAKPEAGVTYTIRFTVTRAGFDRTVKTFDDPAEGKKPARTGVLYADEIGLTVKSVEGTEGSYTMARDDLYVRATVVSTRKTAGCLRNEPEYDTAWTQPYGWRLRKK